MDPAPPRPPAPTGERRNPGAGRAFQVTCCLPSHLISHSPPNPPLRFHLSEVLGAFPCLVSLLTLLPLVILFPRAAPTHSPVLNPEPLAWPALRTSSSHLGPRAGAQRGSRRGGRAGQVGQRHDKRQQGEGELGAPLPHRRSPRDRIPCRVRAQQRPPAGSQAAEGSLQERRAAASPGGSPEPSTPAWSSKSYRKQRPEGAAPALLDPLSCCHTCSPSLSRPTVFGIGAIPSTVTRK